MSGRLHIGDQTQVRAPPCNVVPTLWQCVVVAMKIAVIGGVTVATAECLSSFLVKAKHFEGGRWPTQLFAQISCTIA